MSGLVSRLPSYHIVKDKVSCDRGHLSSVCFALQSRFSDADATEGDGLRLDWPDKWVQVRASNTEPILRIIAEARTGDEANALCRQAREIVRKCGVTSHLPRLRPRRLPNSRHMRLRSRLACRVSHEDC